MALEFTNIPDRTGAAVYVFGNGTTQTERRLIAFGEEVDSQTPDETQVVYLDPTRGDGLRVKEFYALTNFPCVLILMDDDTIPYSWSGEIPKEEEVVYRLSQLNGSMRSS